MSWKILVGLSLILITSQVLGVEYFLEIERSCSTTGDKLDFKCEKKDGEKFSIFSQNGRWFGRNPNSDDLWKLTVLKDDKHILVLDNPVLFSGESVIYIMKPTRRFYWSEFAYSDILNEQEGTVRYGRVLSVKN
ncbi:hypothetical protein [Methylocaldum sp. RMAD-M]|uniref:hypothetical protein n=1 Tax=Methylocaldum sp. RMAD-M TaxID=2806557 RepID=UPI00111C87D3|nr:hypothetical protein [Methylocaldum sp. RMAD-M]MBP1152806.1 hypothetical protein [Methylocaldum sp. RMAD-M]